MEVLIYHPEISARKKGAKAHAQGLNDAETFCGRPPSGVPYHEESTARELLAMAELCGGCKRHVHRLMRFGAIS